MTRIQMANKIKEAVDNIENDKLPYYLSLDREHLEYLQSLLYELMEEFRRELITIGVTVAQIEDDDVDSDDDERALDLSKFMDFKPVSQVDTEQVFTSLGSADSIPMENKNGLRLDDGYNLRLRSNAWITFFNHLTFSARPAFRLTDNENEIFLDEAAAKLAVSNVELSVEKSGMWWGPGAHGAMLMSNNAEPLSVVRLRSITPFQLPWELKHMGSFGLNFFVGRLEKDRRVPRPDIAGLRIGYSPLPYLSLGASRVAVMGGDNRANPRSGDYWKIFMAKAKDEFTTGEEKRTDTDQLAAMDMKFAIPFGPDNFIATGMEAYTEWAGEDRFSFWENESPGLLMGLFLTNLFRDEGTDFRVEYAKNKPAWYNHGIFNAAGTGTAYTYKGDVIGHHMGGDSDDFFIRISKELPFLSNPFFNSIGIGAQLDIERNDLSGSTGQEKIETGADVLLTTIDRLDILLKYEMEYYRNLNGVSGKTARNHIVSLEGNLRF
ncbi:MAG: capsule assembly Wzi family protein [Candidatus Omnitrophota bacterium]